MHQKTFALWISGLSAAGKTTLARNLKQCIEATGQDVFHLDGDDLRAQQTKALSFSAKDRSKNILIAGSIAREKLQQGKIVLASFITPFEKDRQALRELIAPFPLYIAFLDTPLTTCTSRDPKGLYKKALAGEIPHFTGISSTYEIPVNPDIYLNGEKSPEELTKEVFKKLFPSKQAIT